MSELIRYDAAVKALAACRSADEAKSIRDKAEAMRHYARQASNRDLEISAAEIRLRAEFRLGELLIAAKAAGQVKRGQPSKKRSGEEQFPRVTLRKAGIDRKLSMRAQRLAQAGLKEFAARLAAWRARAEQTAERVSVDLMREQDKKAARANRERVMGGLQLAMPPGKAGVIYVDVPRKFKARSDETGMDRAPDNHYRTMTFEQLLDLDVPSIAADDCVIYYWSTAASLLDDIEIMAEWGFVALRPRDADGKILRGPDRAALPPPQLSSRSRKYCSHQVWDKELIGTGYWFRDRHEVLLVATKGHPPAPAQGTQDDSLFAERRDRHSAKPARVRDAITRLYPTMPKLELFARASSVPDAARLQKQGWRFWGDQAEPAKPKTAKPRTAKPKRRKVLR